jgi:hypothetical protein
MQTSNSPNSASDLCIIADDGAYWTKQFKVTELFGETIDLTQDDEKQEGAYNPDSIVPNQLSDVIHQHLKSKKGRGRKKGKKLSSHQRLQKQLHSSVRY